MARINPRQIEAFRALMLAGTTTAAADLMRVTQPAVSRLLRDLQHALGLTLFDRRGTRLVPTSEAIALYDEVQRSFVGLDRIAAVAQALGSSRTGTLRVAGLPALANGFLPRFAARFLHERPGLHLELHGLVSHLVLDWVAAGQCDVGFAAAPVEHAGVVTDKMPPVRLVAIVPAGHRLARKRLLRPRDFEGERFVAMSRTTPTRFQVDGVFDRHGVQREIFIETSLSEIVCATVAAGAGVALVEPFSAHEHAVRGFAVRPFEPALEFEFAALWSPHRPVPRAAREFLEAFRDEVVEFKRRLAPRGLA
ncbi:MAG: LysR substrate-binding domain-containing protein [Rubrivivax sp.]